MNFNIEVVPRQSPAFMVTIPAGEMHARRNNKKIKIILAKSILDDLNRN
jgi:hypothetical protein